MKKNAFKQAPVKPWVRLIVEAKDWTNQLILNMIKKKFNIKLLVQTNTPSNRKSAVFRERAKRIIWFPQEPITRSLQLLHIPVTAFSQTDLFLV